MLSSSTAKKWMQLPGDKERDATQSITTTRRYSTYSVNNTHFWFARFDCKSETLSAHSDLRDHQMWKNECTAQTQDRAFHFL